MWLRAQVSKTVACVRAITMAHLVSIIFASRCPVSRVVQAAVCKTVYVGAIPTRDSILKFLEAGAQLVHPLVVVVRLHPLHDILYKK